MRKIDNLLLRISKFEKLAQTLTDMQSAEQFFNTPLPEFGESFHDLAYRLFAELEKKQPGIEDMGASQGPVYQLSNLMGAHRLPDPGQFLSLTQGVFSVTKEMYTPGTLAYNLGSNLVRYAQILINRYLVKQPETPQVQSMPEETIVGDTPSAPKAPASENAYQFITRVYKQIRTGQGATDEDRQKWPNYKTNIVKRLNGLKGLATRTPQQDQEKMVLQALIDALGA